MSEIDRLLDRYNPSKSSGEDSLLDRYEPSSPSSGGSDIDFLLDQYNPEKNVAAESDGGFIGDLAASFGAGSNSLMKLGGDIYGLASGDMENYFSEQGQRGIEYYQGKKSKQLKGLEKQRALDIKNADGFAAKAGTAFWGTVSSPSLFTSFMVEQLPMLITTGGAGRAASLGVKVAGGGKAAMATGGTAGAVATGAAMAGGDAGSGAYDQLMQIPDELWNKRAGFTDRAKEIGAEEAKKEIALDLSQDAAISAAITSGALNYMIPGARNLEKVMAGGALPKGRAMNTVTGFFGETVQEFLEEGGGKFLGNAAAQTINPDQALDEGVAEAGGLGAVGGVFGGVSGLASPTSKDPDPVKFVDPIEAGKEAEQRATDDIATVMNEPTVEGSIDAMNEAMDDVIAPVVEPVIDDTPDDPDAPGGGLDSLVKKGNNANGEFFETVTEGVGSVRISQTGNGVFAKRESEGTGKKTDTVLNLEGDLVNAKDINRNEVETEDGKRPYIGTPESRQFIGKLLSLGENIEEVSDEQSSTLDSIVKRLVLEEITLEQARSEYEALGSPPSDGTIEAALLNDIGIDGEVESAPFTEEEL